MNPDFHDMLSEFINHGVEFLVVGGYAMAAHDLPRATGDIDLWVRCSTENAERIWKSLEAFHAPMHLFTKTDLAEPGMVVQLGIPPNRIDIINQIEGVAFDERMARPFDVRLRHVDCARDRHRGVDPQ